MNLTFLGTGTSVGVPVIGCSCPVCTSSDPRNNRTRCSLHLEHLSDKGSFNILIDAGPDLRQQALRENLTQIDAVLYTHDHLDHVAGFDELRAFCWHHENPLPLYAHPTTLTTLQRMFPWAFTNHGPQRNTGYVQPDPIPITSPIKLSGLTITPLPVIHTAEPCYGYRIDTPDGQSLAYLCDVKTIPDETWPLMENLDLLIIDALRLVPHPTHLSVEESIAISQKLGSPKTLFTHCTHEIDYETISATLPKHITLAYDGQKISL